MADASDIDSKLRALKPRIDKKADEATAALRECEKLLDELSLGFPAEMTIDQQDSPRTDADDENQRRGPFADLVELAYKRESGGGFELVLISGRWDQHGEAYTEPPTVYPCAQAPRALRILVSPAHIVTLKTMILEAAEKLVGRAGPVVYAATTEADKR